MPLYGGQVAAQALRAAGLTVPDGRLPHAMRDGGDPDQLPTPAAPARVVECRLPRRSSAMISS